MKRKWLNPIEKIRLLKKSRNLEGMFLDKQTISLEQLPVWMLSCIHHKYTKQSDCSSSATCQIASIANYSVITKSFTINRVHTMVHPY